jgi:hypothetical protein
VLLHPLALRPCASQIATSPTWALPDKLAWTDRFSYSGSWIILQES